jgi:hypothetical protein
VEPWLICASWRGEAPTFSNSRLEKPEVQFRKAVFDNFDRPRSKAQMLGHRIQVFPQLDLALPDPVSDLAALERRETWAGELPPGVSLQCFQRIYVAT